VRALFLVLLLLNLAFFAYMRLGEPGDGTGGADAGPPIPPLRRAGDGKGGPRCVTLGPFTTQTGAQRAAAALLSSHHGSKLHAADAPGASSYWVVVATKTMQDATRIGMRLRAGGVTDLVIMPPEANGTDAVVSLGVFSERERADRRVQDLKRYAVAPSIIEQPHSVTTWWLDVELAAGEPTPDIAALAKTAGESGSVRGAACPAPAPPAAGAPPAAPAPAAPAAAKPAA
jgi:hypothetical protein